MNKDEIRSLIDAALSYGYHTAKDEEKGVRSAGYGTRFFELHDIEQKLQQHGVMQGLPTDSDISAAAINSIDYVKKRDPLRDYYADFFEKGARWVISKLSSSPSVGDGAAGQNVSGGHIHYHVHAGSMQKCILCGEIKDLDCG